MSTSMSGGPSRSRAKNRSNSRPGPEIAVVDIWRIDDGLIAEAWEIIESVAQAAANLAWWVGTQCQQAGAQSQVTTDRPMV
jgi:hypothetical protein